MANPFRNKEVRNAFKEWFKSVLLTNSTSSGESLEYWLKEAFQAGVDAAGRAAKEVRLYNAIESNVPD